MDVLFWITRSHRNHRHRCMAFGNKKKTLIYENDLIIIFHVVLEHNDFGNIGGDNASS